MSIRTEQVSANLQKILGEIFSRDIEWPTDTMGTISRIEVPGDLKTANIFVSVLPYDRSQDVINFLNNQKKDIQKQMSKKLSMKFSPRLRFQVEHSTEYADRIDRALLDDE